ncbi:MAG TPA: NUDIX pyrophosphatase [Candidatus Thermoplasmatota archaeon]|nr:NUDIX pyrophosphatase [Candidatus Thermoplasmatota archaeon]
MALRRKVMVFLYRSAPALQVLLLKRAKADKGDWHPVTGNVEPHEHVRNAAVREVAEETGLAVEPEPLGLTFTYEHKGRRFHETAYAARAAPDDEVTLSEEHTDHRWLAPDEARAQLSWPEQQKALDLLAQRYGPR